MLTDGCWSPTRPSVFFTTRTDGWMEAWDIIENQRTPVMTHKVEVSSANHLVIWKQFQVHEGPAHCITPHSEGFLLCIGGDSGEVSLLQLSSSLVDVTKTEKVSVSTMLERESRREKILSAINKEAALKAKAKNKMKMMMQSGMLKQGEEKEKIETATKAAEDRFFELLKTQKDERIKLGKPLIFDDYE